MKSYPTTKTCLTKALKKMTLKNRAKLLDKVISYYGLQFEGFLWEEVHKLKLKTRRTK
jgi:hypothetical protein